MDTNVQREAVSLETAGVLVLRLGRGRTGGSTVLDLLVQRARAAGRPVMVGDGDRRNPSLAALYPPGTPGGATQPRSDEMADGKEWVTSSVGEAVQARSSLVLDMGAGDKTMQDYARDLDILKFCASVGMQTLGLFFSGLDMEDFEHVVSIWKAGYFRPKRSIMILNEHLVPQGRTPHGSFDAITSSAEFLEMSDAGVELIMLPRLPCLHVMRRAGLGFMDAASGRCARDGAPFDPVRQFMVKQWLEKFEAQIAEAGAAGWLP